MTESQLPSTTRPRIPRKRDEAIRRFVRRCRSLAPHLESATYAPLLQSFGRISLLLARGYENLRDGEIIGADGELRPSVDAVRRLAETQTRIAKELGLTPLTLRALSREKVVDLASEMAEQV